MTLAMGLSRRIREAQTLDECKEVKTVLQRLMAHVDAKSKQFLTPCAGCEKKIAEHKEICCDGCDGAFCRGCIRSCDTCCEVHLCEECNEDEDKDAQKITFCGKCKSNSFCKKCASEDTCHECESAVCEDCQKFCTGCDSAFCDDCITSCDACYEVHLCEECNEDNAEMIRLCENCETHSFCTGCASKDTCECGVTICGSCELKQHGPNFYCRDCFDYVNEDWRY